MQRLVSILERGLTRGGLTISATKSKTMVLAAASPSEVPLVIRVGAQQQQQQQPMEQVRRFTYLGTIFTAAGGDAALVEACVGKAWGLFNRLLRATGWRYPPLKLRGQLYSVYVRSGLLADAAHLRNIPGIDRRLTHTCREIEILLVEGREVLHDPEKRLPDAERQRRLGIAAPVPLVHRQQLRHTGTLLLTHRERPTTVTMIVAGRLDQEAYPEAYARPPPPAPACRQNYHQVPHDTHGVIIRRLDAYATPTGGAAATRAFMRQRFGANYHDSFIALKGYEVVERPLDNAWFQQARCPHCQQWYTDDAGALEHVRRRHADMPEPATFFHERGVVGGGRGGRRGAGRWRGADD